MIVDWQVKTKEEKEWVSEARTVDKVSLKSHRREAQHKTPVWIFRPCERGRKKINRWHVATRLTMPRKRDENETAFGTFQEILRRDAARDGIPQPPQSKPEKLPYQVKADHKAGKIGGNRQAKNFRRNVDGKLLTMLQRGAGRKVNSAHFCTQIGALVPVRRFLDCQSIALQSWRLRMGRRDGRDFRARGLRNLDWCTIPHVWCQGASAWDRLV